MKIACSNCGELKTAPAGKTSILCHPCRRLRKTRACEVCGQSFYNSDRRTKTCSVNCGQTLAVEKSRQHYSTVTPKYKNVHRRLFANRGRAKEYRCQHCSGPASEWAYDHNDPNELYEDWMGRGHLAPFSTSLDHYIPLCSSCHKKFDLQTA